MISLATQSLHDYFSYTRSQRLNFVLPRLYNYCRTRKDYVITGVARMHGRVERSAARPVGHHSPDWLDIVSVKLTGSHDSKF